MVHLKNLAKAAWLWQEDSFGDQQFKQERGEEAQVGVRDWKGGGWGTESCTLRGAPGPLSATPGTNMAVPTHHPEQPGRGSFLLVKSPGLARREAGVLDKPGPGHRGPETTEPLCCSSFSKDPEVFTPSTCHCW
jgi:hypothetical protein